MRPESLELQLPHASAPITKTEVSCSHFFLSGFLPYPLAPNVHLGLLCGAHPFPSLGWKPLWALQKVGRAWGGDASGGERGRGSVLGPGEDWLVWVGGDQSLLLDTQRQTGWISSGYISLGCIKP